MTLTLRLLGLELIHLDVSTDTPDAGGYDHDVGATSVESEAGGDVAMGFVPTWVGE